MSTTILHRPASSLSPEPPRATGTYRVQTLATVRPMPARLPVAQPRAAGAPSASETRVAALVRRYLAHDLAGWLCALLFGCATQLLTGSLWMVALAATMGDNLGFYGSIWLREEQRERRLGLQPGWRVRLRRLLREFALAEVLDALAVRPLMIGIATYAAGSAVAGITLGGSVADLLFYACAWKFRPGDRRR